MADMSAASWSQTAGQHGEVPVPESDVPGERLSPTQPIPIKPPSFARQGLSEDELIDFTPELKAKAQKILNQYRYGDIYMPPSLAEADDGTFGTLFMPSQTGGANWPGGAADPETGIMYIFSKSDVGRMSMSNRPDRSDMDYINLQTRSAPPLRVDGLPLIKPPYGQIVALDLNEGEILWDAVHGETPDYIRNHTALAGIDIARTGQAGRVGLSLEDSVLASDAFFPFPDGLEAAVAAGARAIIQPGGSNNDDSVIEAADKLGVPMVFTGVRHFRH